MHFKNLKKEVKKMRKENKDYLELISRNVGFISQLLQEKIKSCSIAILGCGVGSVVAELSVRTGFSKIIIADGDKVEYSNLNRQAFYDKDVGIKKTEVLKKKLKAINHELTLKVYSRFLKESDLPSVIKESDIIIDTIGIDALPLIVKLHQEARKQRKVVLDPINIGFGGGVFIFTKDSMPFEEMIGIDYSHLSRLSGPEEMLPYWANLCKKFLPPYLVTPFKQFLVGVKKRGWCFVPQLGIGVYITAALTVTLMIKLVDNKPVKLAPEFYFVDAILITEPKIKRR